MRDRKKYTHTLIFVFFLLLVTNYYIAGYVKNSLHDNIFIVSLPNNQSFSQDNINYLQQEGYYFTFESKINTQASSSTVSTNVNIIGTNENFAEISRKNLLHGAFFNQFHNEYLSNVIVIDSNVSWKLFGTTDSIGRDITIDNNRFEVIGVIENKTSEDDINNVYVPYDVFKGLNDSKEISIYELCMYANGTASLNLIINNLGYKVEDIEIIDLGLYINIIMQRVSVIFILAIGYIIFCLYKKCLKSIKSLIIIFKEFLKDNYLVNIRLIFNNKNIIKELFLLFASVAIIVLIIKTNNFHLYLPDNIFSIQTLDFDTIVSILNFFILQDFASTSFLYLNNINMVSNIIFFINVVLSFFVFTYLKTYSIKFTNSFIDYLQV